MYDVCEDLLNLLIRIFDHMKQQLINKLLQSVHQSYSIIADDFSRTRQSNWTPVESLVQKYVQSGYSIFDAGCGQGRLVQALSDLSLPLTYTGCDMSDSLVHEAQARYGSNYKEVLCSWQVSDITALSLSRYSYNIIFCIASFHHIPSQKLRKKVVRVFHEALKPSGFLIMMNWNLWTRKAFQKYGLASQLFKNMICGYELGDFFIPWKNADEKICTNRYYHSFRLGEFVDLFDSESWDFQEYQNIKCSRNDRGVARSFLTVAQKRNKNSNLKS